MSTIHTKTSSSESVSVVGDGEGTTEYRVAAHGPYIASAATGDRAESDDAENSDASVNGNESHLIFAAVLTPSSSI